MFGSCSPHLWLQLLVLSILWALWWWLLLFVTIILTTMARISLWAQLCTPIFPRPSVSLYHIRGQNLDLMPWTLIGADLIGLFAESQVWTTAIPESEFSSRPIDIDPVHHDQVNDFQTRYAVWGIFQGLVKMWQRNEVSEQNAIPPRANTNDVEVWLDDSIRVEYASSLPRCKSPRSPKLS